MWEIWKLATPTHKHSMPSSKNKVNPCKPPRRMKLILAIFSPKKWMEEKTTPGEWLATDARLDPWEVHLHRSFCRNSITVRTWNDVMRTLDVNGIQSGIIYIYYVCRHIFNTPRASVCTLKNCVLPSTRRGPPDMFFSQTVCPDWGVLTVGVKVGAWSGCSLCSHAFYL